MAHIQKCTKPVSVVETRPCMAFDVIYVSAHVLLLLHTYVGTHTNNLTQAVSSSEAEKPFIIKNNPRHIRTHVHVQASADLSHDELILYHDATNKV